MLVFVRSRKRSLDQSKIVRSEFDYMINLGIVRPSDSNGHTNYILFQRKIKVTDGCTGITDTSTVKSYHICT